MDVRLPCSSALHGRSTLGSKEERTLREDTESGNFDKTPVSKLTRPNTANVYASAIRRVHSGFNIGIVPLAAFDPFHNVAFNT